MIPLNPQQLPPQNSDWVSGSHMTQKAFFLIRSLFNRTGGNSGIPNTVGAGLTAAGASQVTALALTNDFNEVTGGSGGVMLAMLRPGQLQWVYNGLGGGLNVYPFSNGQIDANAVNGAYSLNAGKTQMFWCPKLLASGGTFYRSVSF